MQYIITSAIAILAALAFIALGMRIANENNKRAWEKYYEGQRSKESKYLGNFETQYKSKVVSMNEAKRAAH